MVQHRWGPPVALLPCLTGSHGRCVSLPERCSRRADAKDRGSGFMFGPPQPNAMLQAVDHAVHVYRGNRAAWQLIQKNGMEQASP